ncbi:MAG: hypothetical protein JOZ57_02770 [Abitibacteriaceae bacterium]|nr:hypothetical protein [Abditibacteriaceae bacterium]
MESIATLLFIVSTVNLCLAGLVFWRRPQAEINRVFAVTASSVAAWTVTNALFQATESVAAATLWANISYVSALIVVASLFHFSQIYPAHGDHLHRRIAPHAAWGLWLVTIFCGIMPFLPHFVINHVELTPERRIITNPGFYLLALFIFATVLGAMRSLLRSLIVTHGKERMQARYVLTGMAVTAAFGLICNLVLPLLNNYSLVWLGPASSLVFVGCTVYSIIKERLFDIRIIIHRSLVYGLLLSIISGIYSAIEFGLTDLLQRSTTGNQHPLLANIGTAVLVSLCVQPVRKWLERQLDRMIFQRRRKYKQK